MPRRRRFVPVTLVLCTLLALGALSSLAGAQAAGAPPTPRPTAKTHAPRSVLRLAITNAAPSVDPAQVADEENVQLAGLLYSGLVKLDSSYHVIPDAAQRIDISPDHRVYTFHLRPNLRFSNGDPVVAQDFAWSITRSLDPTLKSLSAPIYLLDIQGATQVLDGKAKKVAGIKVIDAHTLRLTARWPVPYFLMELTYPTSFALDPKAIDKYGGKESTSWYAHPVGSGPYRLKSWTPNSRMVLTRNPHYYGARPSVSEVTISLQPLPATEPDLYKYVTHSLDAVSLPSFDSTLLARTGIHATKMLSIAGVYFNLGSKPYVNVHVRRALTLALNRPSLVKKEMGSVVTPFEGNVPPGEAGYDRGLHPLGYDRKAARRELQLGGYTSGSKFPPITLYYGVDPNDPQVARLIGKLAQAIAHAWHSVLGIPATTAALTPNALVAKAQSNELAVYLLGWSADYPDAHDWLSEQWKTKAINNIVDFSDPRFDATVEAADVTWKPARRTALYDQAQQLLVDDAAWVPLYIPHRLVYIRPSVSNLYLTGYGLIPRYGSWAQVKLQSRSSSPSR